MECLIDYIGVFGCGLPIPPSGLYINQLPGITLKSMDKIANDEQVTWLEVWKDVQGRASRRFNTTISKYFNKTYKLNRLNKSHCLNSTDYDDTPIGIDNKWKGFILKLDEIDSNALSAFQTLFIPHLKLPSAKDAHTTIKVFDLNTNDELYELEVTCNQGWNTIQVNKQFFSNWIFVAYDASGVSAYDLIVSEDADGNQCPCLVCDTCTVTVQGAASDDLNNPTMVTAGTNSFGLTGCFNVTCSFNSLVCRNKNVFSDAWMKLLGSELMVERVYSERINKYTTAGKKEAQELMDFFNVEFEDSLKDTVAGIQLDDNDCCFVCNNGGVQQTKSVM